MKKGFLLVLSGHSGAGKNTLLKKILASSDEYYYSISTTTRDKRDGEVDGIDYNFTTKEDFNRRIELDEFLEYAHIHGDNYYGTSSKDIDKQISNGKIVILEIDTQGFMQVKSRYKGDIISIFLATSTLAVMKERLRNRGSESEATLTNRVHSAYKELSYIDNYDYLIINDDLAKTIISFNDIMKAVKYSIKSLNIESFIKKWDIKE